jgi:hypothetical protein
MTDMSLTSGVIAGQPQRGPAPVQAPRGGWPPPQAAPVGPGAERSLQLAAEAAAQALHAEKAVKVSSFYDEATGRQIYRVADPVSGQVLSQSPPEELLRLYAAIREDGRPLVEVEA